MREVTKEMIIDELNRQSLEVKKMIVEMEKYEALKDRIPNLELVLRVNDYMMLQYDWDNASQDEIQSYYNTIIANKQSGPN
jgi:hypothetical protein